MSSRVHPAGDRHADVLPGDHPLPPPADLNEIAPQVWPRTARRRDGALTVGGADVRDLASEFGTPLYVLDEDDFRQRAREYAQAFADGSVHYAGKAFLSGAVVKWLHEEGLGLDVCSGGELALALAVGFPAEKITLHGNNKSADELVQALEAGVGHIVLDSFEEIARLGFHAERLGVRPKVMLRVTTGVEAHTHEFIATAHDDQKFGFSRNSGAALEAVRRVIALDQLDLVGLHSHIGSQIFEPDGFEVAAHRLAELLVKIKEEHGVVLPELDLGGGFGISYLAGDEPIDAKIMADNLRRIVAKECLSYDLPVPHLTVEPGRAIVGPGGITVYEVGTIKDVEGIRTYVSVDGGMSDNLRTALYGAEYTAALVSRESAAAPMLCRIVGKHCESGDIVVRDLWLPEDIAPGDLVAVAATGAYCRSMASNYNFLPKPAVVAVRDGKGRVIVRRETPADLLRLDAEVGER
ncbi:diaminopimelate decarboxylase [Actinocorallia longicatena]|uniref:diaminopimelate decarboxylase n=1 Tax=Actinocorallia longicatena TaxID=111803 RepID=UPI0031DE8503